MKSNSILLGLSALFSVCEMMIALTLVHKFMLKDLDASSPNSSNATMRQREFRMNLQVEEVITKQITNQPSRYSRQNKGPDNTVSVHDVKAQGSIF